MNARKWLFGQSVRRQKKIFVKIDFKIDFVLAVRGEKTQKAGFLHFWVISSHFQHHPCCSGHLVGGVGGTFRVKLRLFWQPTNSPPDQLTAGSLLFFIFESFLVIFSRGIIHACCSGHLVGGVGGTFRVKLGRWDAKCNNLGWFLTVTFWVPTVTFLT